MTFYADYNRFQERLLRTTGPLALQLMRGVTRSTHNAEVYRDVNRRPMRFWMAVSLAPHSTVRHLQDVRPARPVPLVAADAHECVALLALAHSESDAADSRNLPCTR
jgi:hypothetical protein